jgi:hypothetical protein
MATNYNSCVQRPYSGKLRLKFSVQVTVTQSTVSGLHCTRSLQNVHDVGALRET